MDKKIKMYEQDEALVEEWQCQDPALTNVTDLIMRMLQPLDGRALDVGCGTGRVAVRLAEQGFSVDALDVEEKVLDIARGVAERCKLDISFILCDFAHERDRYASDSYDVVVCMEVLEHVENWQSLVEGMRRVLKPGGTLIITVISTSSGSNGSPYSIPTPMTNSSFSYLPTLSADAFISTFRPEFSTPLTPARIKTRQFRIAISYLHNSNLYTLSPSYYR